MAPYNLTHPAPNPEPTAESGPLLLADVAWFDANWMWFSTAFAPISLILICVVSNGTLTDKLKNPYVVGWLNVTFYFVHQFEEHGYDARGWRYGFVPGFNHGVGSLLFSECKVLGHTACPLDPRLGTYINVMAIWFGYVITMLIAHCLGGPYAYAGLLNWGTSVVNAFGGHLLPWVLSGYNSGALQSIFMFMFGVFAITRDGPKFALTCILNGVFFHAISFGIGVNLILKAHFPPEVDTLLCFLTASALPLAFARCTAPSQSRWYHEIKDGDGSESAQSESDEP